MTRNYCVVHMSEQLNQLENIVREIAEKYPFAVQWQIREVASGAIIGASDHDVVGSFSTRKVSVLLACLALVKSGKLSLDETYVIDEQLKDGVQSGVMRNLSAGIELSLRDHLAQMMITSDNICTQIVFRAIEEATGDALQWVNDYCVQTGMYDTLHREIFPRSAELAWSHSIEDMTVTSANDQALLLEHLAKGSMDKDHAGAMGLSRKLCSEAINMMSNLFTPLFGARLQRGAFAEKNGRGIRGLSQVGLLLDANDQPVASVAVYAESIPVELSDGTPGRVRGLELFVELGQAIEEFFLCTDADETVKRRVVEPDYWGQEFGELIFAVEGGRAVLDDMVFTFSGVGKLLFACTLAAQENTDPEFFDHTVEITAQHRAFADTGPIQHLSGPLQLSVADAVNLMISSGDGAATLALLDHCASRGIDIVEQGRQYTRDLPNTTITGVEERSSGEGFVGTTTAADLLTVLRQIIDADGRVMQWMSSVFEPAGLASSLPGYGPHTVKHWTTYDWTRLTSHQDEGRSSVLILNCPQGFVGLAAHAPVGTVDVAAKFGGLGLSALVNK